MLTLTNELTEARGSLRKEILNSKEANKRAEKAELELKELQKQLEKRTVTEEIQKEVLINIYLILMLFNQKVLKYIFSVLWNLKYILDIMYFYFRRNWLKLVGESVNKKTSQRLCD